MYSEDDLIRAQRSPVDKLCTKSVFTTFGILGISFFSGRLRICQEAYDTLAMAAKSRVHVFENHKTYEQICLKLLAPCITLLRKLIWVFHSHEYVSRLSL